MKPKPLLLLALLALAIALIGFLVFSAGDERAIRSQFKHLARACEKKQGQTLIRSAFEANDLRNYFTSNAVVNLGRATPTQLSRTDIPALVARVHASVDSLSITIQGIDFEPRTTKNERELRAAVEFTAQTGASKESYLDEYRIHWRKIDRTWRIQSVHADSAIARPMEL